MNVPNSLSVFRILLIPLFVILFGLLPREQYYWLAVVLLISGLTDVLDGFIARRFHQITDLGKILDPIADKLTVATILFCIALLYPAVILVLSVYIAKEILMGVGALILAGRGIRSIASKWFGKLATSITYTIMFLFIIIPHISDLWLIILNILAIAVTLFALILYSFDFSRLMKQSAERCE